ncbi:MAG TPA: PadR family transcriptional regulator [Thermoplasmatales archaeon]|nr:PadR family transcriptional regulator [Thermoplasmatales archaeon]
MYERKILLGFIRVHILHHAEKEGIYGAAMIDELRRHGYAMSPGTLYPILHEMERDGALTSREAVVDGRRIRRYTATPAGSRLLRLLRSFVAELSREVIP